MQRLCPIVRLSPLSRIGVSSEFHIVSDPNFVFADPPRTHTRTHRTPSLIRRSV